MKLIPGIVLFVILFSAGCANPAIKMAVTEAATAADAELAVATFAMCRAITVGAWVRAYGSDAAKAEAWRALCAAPVTQLPAK